MRIAVVSDAISPGHYFPLWVSYYGELFGRENLHVVVPESRRALFADFRLGGIYSAEFFDNDERVRQIAAISRSILQEHDVVVRADTDEFLVVEPSRYASLRSYIEETPLPHVSSRGFNLIPWSGDGSIRISAPILGVQRRFAYPYAALNKTSIIREPVDWLPGFHFASCPPVMDSLFLIHLKLADIEMQVEIGRDVADFSRNAQFIEYHQTPREVLEGRLSEIQRYPLCDGNSCLWRKEYTDEFLRSINLIGGFFTGPISPPERVLVDVGDCFKGVF